MIRLEGGAGLIDKVIRSRRLKALALNKLRFFASSNCDFQDHAAALCQPDSDAHESKDFISGYNSRTFGKSAENP